MKNITSFPQGSTVFCDDMRVEITGKGILIGVYTGDMRLFSDEPTSIPLCVSTTFVDNESSKKLELVVSRNEDGADFELLRHDITPANVITPENYNDIDAGKAGLERATILRANFKIPTVDVSKDCVIKVRIYKNEDSELRCGALRIIFRPANESPQIVAAKMTATAKSN